jgi:hypothetical protein
MMNLKQYSAQIIENNHGTRSSSRWIWMSIEPQRILSDYSAKSMEPRLKYDVHRSINPFGPRDEIKIPKEIYAELFYDLFFVAALTTFGVNHEITQDQSIATYIAFFVILW